MSKKKVKEMQSMSKSDREKRLKELKLELMKSKTATEKQGGSKSREIRKMIARILTLNKKEEKK